ncbi:hypothetical protein [Proteus mirabilis]|uniref:hypothetical protein n=1 Tax=Proteus mirabilis TaxID=584 RepID=UPI0023B0940F|nr:hypothetical protein [Proteus mirabilis]
MDQQVITDISLSARIIGAAFYYPPTEKSDIAELLSSGKWLTEWPYGSEEEKQRIALRDPLIISPKRNHV